MKKLYLLVSQNYKGLFLAIDVKVFDGWKPPNTVKAFVCVQLHLKVIARCCRPFQLIVNRGLKRTATKS